MRGYARHVPHVLLLHSDGSIRTRAGDLAGRHLASHDTGSPIADAVTSGGLLVAYSGRLDMPHRTWGLAGAEALNLRAERLRTIMREQGATVLLRPHHADILSDIQRCLAFARAERGGLNLAMDPVALLAPSMIAGAADHLSRFADAIVTGPAPGAIVLTNLAADTGSTDPSPIHRGGISHPIMRSLAVRMASLNVPLLLLDAETEIQLDLLRSWGVGPD